MAQASKAILPRDVGGSWDKRIRINVGGELNLTLRVGAYVTGRVKSTDWLCYSLVFLNCEHSTRFKKQRKPIVTTGDDDVSGWNPTPVQMTIESRGMQVRLPAGCSISRSLIPPSIPKALYTFPVGVTTLWCYGAQTTGPLLG
jgi:hypothetical protein